MALLKRVVVGILASGSLILAFGASADACEATPWWGLTSESWPTSLHAGVAQSEAQEITVSATSGNFYVEDPGTGDNDKGQGLPYNATHEAVQSALEGIYGKGNVEVPSGQGNEAGSEPYEIRFMGKLAAQPVQVQAREYSPGFACSILKLCPLEGGTRATAIETREAAQGRPDGKIIVTAQNLGDEAVDGLAEPVVLEDTLPEHLQAVAAEAVAGEKLGAPSNRGPVTCSLSTPHRVRCVYEGLVLPPYEEIELRISVTVAGASSGEVNALTVSGGGARPAALTRPISVGALNSFGVADYEMIPQEEGGAPSTQAGVHPFELTTVATLDMSEAAPEVLAQEPAGMAKDLAFQTPAGLIGNPTPLPRCTEAEFETKEEIHARPDSCPADAAIGVALVTFNLTGGVGERLNTIRAPVFNLPPLRGEPARFGFDVGGNRVYLDTAVRSGGDYGVTVKVSNITQGAAFLDVKLTFWGVPADPAHDNARGWECILVTESNPLQSCPAGVSDPPPFLSMPTSCPLDPHTDQPESLLTTLQADSWAEPHPAHPTEKPLFAEYEMGGLDGCNRLQFNPEIRVTPDGSEGSKPTGLNVDVHVPQTSVLNAEGLAEADVKDITVALPPGVAINPAGGNGLQACSEGLAGFTGFAQSGGAALFTGMFPEPIQPGVNFCPDASKIGEVTIHSPLLPPTQPVKGFVYLATQNQNPFGSLIALYLVAKEPISGFVFKSVGETRLCESAGETIDGLTCQAAGQVIATFLNNPQLAFEDAELHFFGGERAPLASPARCGAYTTRAAFVPWSSEPGEAPRTSTSTFNITSGPNGSPCPGPVLPFAPTLYASSSNVEAGAFTPLTTTITRADGNQDMQSVQLHLPAGLEGLLSTVKLCPEAQANDGTCGPESLIGETTVSAGVGSDPVAVTGGRVYITEKYAGSPFGLSIVNPVKAGPFDLEHDTSRPGEYTPSCDCVVVRARVDVDPHTAQLSVTTDPSGPHAIPHLIDGVPVQIQKVNVTVNRPGFTFNPTNCGKMEVTGVIASDEGASSEVGRPFQVTDCEALQFAPKFTATTAAKASKADGASLSVKVAYPSGALGSESWFNEARLTIPKQLPARLTTIQQGCPAATFEADRGACPAASVIGHAVVHTPVLPVPLEGPVYFVSHGGSRFPDAIVVLQGYGITVELVGETFISGGVTTATFRNTPDVPFESIEVSLPRGPHSEFGAHLPGEKYDFCGQKLRMPIRFRASNGLEISEDAPVGVTGCPKRLTRAQKLAAALRACHKKKNKATRRACERAARRAYGASRTKR